MFSFSTVHIVGGGLQYRVGYTFTGEYRALWNITLKGYRGTMHHLVTLYKDIMSYNETLRELQKSSYPIDLPRPLSDGTGLFIMS